MMEVQWGTPLTLIVTGEGDTQEFSTLEQARYWLCRKWPVSGRERDFAIEVIDAAMNCLTTVGAARRAFISAARNAGFVPDAKCA